MQKFVLDYVERLKNVLDNIDATKVEEIILSLESTIKKKSKVYVLGNGGSSATASHIVNDLGVGLSRRGLMNFDIVSLADNTPVVTAIANDIGYENIFYAQLKDILSSDDVVMAISCSGNSENILKAVNYANEIGTTVIGITGFDGGKLRSLANVNFHVETAVGEYGLVEDVHMILDHIIYTYYMKRERSYGR